MKSKLLLFLLVFLLATPLFSATEPADGTLKWAFATGSWVHSSLAIGADGTIYAGSDDKKLYALKPGGIFKWVFSTGGDVVSSPAIGVDGTINVGSRDNKLYALSPDGTQKWVFITGDWVDSSPAIGADGTIYVGSDDKKLYALKPDGILKWAFTTGGGIYSSPAIGADGTIYVGSRDNKLYALNPDGTQKWIYKTGDCVTSSPAIGTDGTIYVGSNDHKLYAFNPDGTLKWRFTTGKEVGSSPAIGADGTIYVGSKNNKFYAVNPDGTLRWAYTTGGFIDSSPAVGIDGTIFVGSGDHRLYAFNPDGTLKWTYQAGDCITSSPVIDTGGTIYMGSIDNKLYAIQCGSKGDWPKFHQNNANRGKAPGSILIFPDQKPGVETFLYLTGGAGVDKSWQLYNSSEQELTVEKVSFNNAPVSLKTGLPFKLRPGQTVLLSAVFTPLNTGYYETTCEITGTVNDQTKIVTWKIDLGNIFLADGSELAYTARQALTSYQACYAKDPDSAATFNNRGVLYRLLGKYQLAEKCFNQALNKTKTINYGGIKMNLGVIQSDLEQRDQAPPFYNQAVTDIKNNEKDSVLAPQIYYNQSWEAYVNNQPETALEIIGRTIAHPKANPYLQAKAYVLRGAIYLKLKKPGPAKKDFKKAMELDPKGPIGKLAKDNLAMLP